MCVSTEYYWVYLCAKKFCSGWSHTCLEGGPCSPHPMACKVLNTPWGIGLSQCVPPFVSQYHHALKYQLFDFRWIYRTSAFTFFSWISSRRIIPGGRAICFILIFHFPIIFSQVPLVLYILLFSPLIFIASHLQIFPC